MVWGEGGDCPYKGPHISKLVILISLQREAGRVHCKELLSGSLAFAEKGSELYEVTAFRLPVESWGRVLGRIGEDSGFHRLLPVAFSS